MNHKLYTLVIKVRKKRGLNYVYVSEVSTNKNESYAFILYVLLLFYIGILIEVGFVLL